MRRKVLVLCTGNSARSQMAEGLINALRGDRWLAFSAGTHPAGRVHPDAIVAMQELGIDISNARSKSLDEFRDQTFDLVITVCDDAAEECPVWFGQGQRVHIGFPDPARGTRHEFRQVRDDLVRRLIPYLDQVEARGDRPA